MTTDRSLRCSTFALAALLLGPAAAARAEEALPSPPESPPVTLADALRGVKGRGILVAKIEVETKVPAPAQPAATGAPVPTTSPALVDLKGAFTCTLFEDKTPLTVANFVALARGVRPWKDARTGKWVKKPLYDGALFHRVIPDFMIQGGDPDGSGRGGPGYYFDDEIKSELVFDRAGLLAMANKGIDRKTGHGTNGSQFFITGKDTPWLNGRHTIFGQCDPIDFEQKLAQVPAAKDSHRPMTDVVIKKVTIQRLRK